MKLTHFQIEFTNECIIPLLGRVVSRIQGNDMNKKTEESRIAYNKIASEYDTSREGQYTRFHIKELFNIVDLKEGDIVLDVACGNGTLLNELSKIVKIQANVLAQKN